MTSGFRLMTYNVQRCTGLDGKISPERIAEVIASQNPDVVALQELDVRRKRTHGVDQPARLSLLTGMAFTFHARLIIGEEQYGLGILSRRRMEVVTAGPLPSVSILPPREATSVIWAKIDIDGHPVQIFNTHFKHDVRERHRQADALLGNDWIRDPRCRPPFVLCGDLNTPPCSRVYQRFRSQLTDIQTMNGAKRHNTWPSLLPIVRIDHVFVSEGLRLAEARTVRNKITRWASDHLPLVADFEFD